VNFNPDNSDYLGLGPQSKQQDMDGNETSMSARYLIPKPDMLRFVEKEVDNHGTPMRARVLQQYQWSSKAGGYDWYDIPLVVEGE